MPNHFGRSFNNIESEELLKDIETIEEQGCIYQRYYDDEIEGFNLYRIELNPSEIFQYIEALYAYEEFQGFLKQGYSPSAAAGKISSQKIRERVEEYNDWAEEEDVEDQQFSPAAFYADDIEALLTHAKPEDRYEIVPRSRLEVE